MKKSLIALAVAAALPVAAQADVTLSGSVSAKYTSTSKALDVDSDLDIASTEVLANGMTATAGFDVGSEGNSGKASLSGDFGTLTVGSALDADGAFQSGDVAAVVGDTTTGGADESGSEANAIHYSGNMAGVSIQAQINAGTTASGAATDTQTSSNQFGATYDFNGLTAGYAYTTDDADEAVLAVGGVKEAMTATGISYAFGDLSVSAGKASNESQGTYIASYTASFGDLAVTATVKDENGTDKNVVVATYTLGGIAFTADIDSGAANTELTAAYASGDVSASVVRAHDATTDVTVTYAMGNASLTAKRDGGAGTTAVTYKVSF